MHAYLIVGRETGVNEKIQEKARELQAKIFEFPLLKIANARELNNFTKLKVTEKSAIVARNFDRATEETQNAILKQLEEPQENLYFILTATNIEKVMPTILSRCEIIDIGYSISDIKSKDKEKAKEFMDFEIGEKLVTISKINKRDAAIEFMRDLISASHELFLEDSNMVIFMENANKTLRNLEANGNVALQLTNFVINISQNDKSNRSATY